MAYVFYLPLFFLLHTASKGGRAHAETHWGCVGTFTLIALAAALICKYFPANFMDYVTVVIVLISRVIVYVCAPITHEKAPKEAKTMAKCKRRGRQIATAQIIMVVVLCVICHEKYMPYVFGAGLGISVIAGFLLAPYIRKKVGGESGETKYKSEQ